MAFTGTLGKKKIKHGWPRRTPGFQSKHPLNFISHYISNLITWWNVTPAGVLGCRGRAWWKDPVSSQRGRSVSLLPLEGFGEPRRSAPGRPLPASAVSRDLLFVNGSSWAAAMSCQAALRLRALYSAHMQGPAEAARANITSLSGQKIRPTHSKKQAPPFTQTAWGSEIRKTLIWTMGTLSALNPGCPPLEINYV